MVLITWFRNQLTDPASNPAKQYDGKRAIRMVWNQRQRFKQLEGPESTEG
jgi:hypothetical protein